MSRSRLDPEPVPRRDVLGLTALWSTAGALGFALLGMLRLPKAAVLPSPSKRFPIALPDSLAPGEALVHAAHPVALFRDGDGVHAISTVCTHLGCIVRPIADGFECPCHGSRFAPDGSVVKGPAPTALPWLEVTRQADGRYLVDQGKQVPPGTKELA
ncbi:MAG TPA: Rieske 2Fe-2S domain-containing protein [Thermoanaerobaculia bacterium]|nr:Rieske 2Fe-2S domain-containing protein [Thermoanaerobaculia bacterium]